MELVKFENNQLLATEEGMKRLESMRQLDLVKRQLAIAEKEFKKELLKVMEENGIKKFDNDILSVTYVAPTTREKVDTQALKDQGLYDAFTTETKVSASVRISYKEGAE